MDSKTCDAFNRLSDILDTLRRQCPWDRVQTMQSLRHLTIEEVHELSEAIVGLEADPSASSEVQKELGDLAMHVMFYAKIAEEQGLFSMADMYHAVCDKLVERHPFIYHPTDYHGESWEQLKMREGRRGVLDGVPNTLPTLIKTLRMQQKVAGVEGSDHKAESTENLQARIDAVLQAEASTNQEFGQLLFDLVDWARRHSINADDALATANHHFRQAHAGAK